MQRIKQTTNRDKLTSKTILSFEKISEDYSVFDDQTFYFHLIIRDFFDEITNDNLGKNKFNLRTQNAQNFCAYCEHNSIIIQPQNTAIYYVDNSWFFNQHPRNSSYHNLNENTNTTP